MQLDLLLQNVKPIIHHVVLIEQEQIVCKYKQHVQDIVLHSQVAFNQLLESVFKVHQPIPEQHVLLLLHVIKSI